ncbi:MAG: CPBP family intramembrane metalloprotease [Armatimonadetes bacterium]|nr:CPBP family intramembrane metalloprotease [Armatimonadota bacterium]
MLAAALSPYHFLIYLATFVVLYGLLGWPGQGWRGEWPRRSLFATLGILALVAFTLRSPGDAVPGDPGRAFEHYIQGTIAARQALAIRLVRGGMPADEMLQAAIRHYERAVQEAPTSEVFRRELAVLYLARHDLPAARRVAAEATSLLRQRQSPRAEQAAQLWSLALDETPPTPAHTGEVERRVRELDWGLFGDLLVAESYRRAGRAAEAEDLRTELTRRASRYMGRAVLALLFLLLIVGLGAVFTVVALVLARHRLLPREERPWQDAAPILWEGFLLYAFLWTAPAWLQWWDPLARLLAERTPAIIIGVNAASDLIALLAVGYLWWRLRRRGLGLDEVGLRARPLGVNLAWGLAALPIVWVNLIWVSQLTRWVGERWFPQFPQPYHPVESLVVGAGDPWLRLGLFLIAGVGAPVLEEIFFRGALYGAMRRRLNAPTAAVLSAAFFAGLHPQLPLGFIPIFALGLALTFLYEWRRSLVPGIVFHALNNGLILLGLTTLLPP